MFYNRLVSSKLYNYMESSDSQLRISVESVTTNKLHARRKPQSTNFFTKLNLGGGGPWEPMFP